MTNVLEGYAALGTVVTPAAIALTMLRDPAYEQRAGAALGGNAKIIVLGDDHLLDLGEVLAHPNHRRSQ